ncbi:PIN domain-containing protein [Paraburkholderia strydomiana]|uniref:PIN domain-containing protein n=1 Tax=Paraburkholderia strydomiana TaxID=1245417 RepID=A0ABW9BYD5_9BURK
MHEGHIQSDTIRKFRKFYADGAPLAFLTSLFQVNLILDANVVIKELIWATTKRKNPHGRSELLEVLEVETVIAWAPTFLEAEVEKYIPLVVEKGASQEEVTAHWQRLRALITLVDVGGAAEDGAEIRDPKDVPYIRLQEKINATIVTDDKDISAMGGTVVPRIAVMASLRAYSRAAAVQVTFQVSGYTFAGLSVRALSGAAKFVYTTAEKAAMKVPREVWLGMLAALCVAMVVPASRIWLRNQLDAVVGQLGIAAGGIANVTSTLATEYRARKLDADDALAKVHALLGINPAREDVQPRAGQGPQVRRPGGSGD